MSGRNLFEDFRSTTRANASSPICVFISHKSEDKPMARSVAAALLDMGVDIYFDENDTILRAAAASGSDRAIVACIEDGLSRATHLLGLITKHTFNSWWVPYEIGGATGRQRPCGHIVASDVDRLPSYVRVAPLLLDIYELTRWIASRDPRSRQQIMESMTHATQTLLNSFVPNVRISSDITFY